jgi:hypothetical protein
MSITYTREYLVTEAYTSNYQVPKGFKLLLGPTPSAGEGHTNNFGYIQTICSKYII